jgi:hypothetical protein
MRRFAYIAVLLVGCSVSPIPDPPNLQPPDLSRIMVETGTSVPGLLGEPGAVEPGADLWVVNLDTMEPPVTIVTDPDGGFDSGGIPAFVGQELRLQARMGALRSDPVDFLVGGGEIVRPTASCLVLEPTLELALEAEMTTSIQIANDCGSPARIDAIRLRAPSAAIAIETASPLDIADGGSATIDIFFRPDASGLLEEIVILDVTLPEIDRRVVTAFGVGP